MRKILTFCFFTILIGSIYIYPDVRFILEQGRDFKGTTLTGTPDETFYLGRLNAVYKGNYRLTDFGNYEHHNDKLIVPPYPYYEIAAGSLGKALNLPIIYLDIILSFIFPAIIFWLICLLVYYLSKSLKLGILGGASILLGYPLFTTRYDIFREIITLKYSYPLWFLRPFSPQFTYIPFILSFILIFLFIDTNKMGKVVLIGSLLALMNYVHIYLWLFLFVGVGLWFLISLLRKDRIIAKNTILALVLSVILALPYWINSYHISLSPQYVFLKEMLGVEYTRRVIIPLAYLLIGAGIVFLNRKSIPKNFYFLLVFLLSGLVCLNQQVITGKLVSPVYFSTYTNKTFMIIALITSLSRIKVPFKKYISNTLFVVLVGALFLLGLVQQNNYYHRDKKSYSDLCFLSGAIDWLRHNTEKEDVVLVDAIELGENVFVRNLLLYTDNFYYITGEDISLIPRDEQENRILYAMRFFEYSLEDMDSVIRYADGAVLFAMSGRYGLVEDLDEYISKLKDRYRDYMRKDALYLLKQYKIDYVLLGKEDHLFDTIEKKYPALSNVFDDNRYKIFRF